jgi:hypothetical protein
LANDGSTIAVTTFRLFGFRLSMKVLATRIGLRVQKQAVVHAHFGVHAVGHAHPGDGGFDLDGVAAGVPLLVSGTTVASTSVMVPLASFAQPVHSIT